MVVIEDVARRVVVERRPHRVAGNVVVRVSHDPKIGAADPDAGVGRAPNNRDLVSEQCELIAAGGDQGEAQVLIVGVDDVDRDVEAVQVGGVGTSETGIVEVRGVQVPYGDDPCRPDCSPNESSVPAVSVLAMISWIVTEVVKGDRDLAGGDPHIS